MENGEWSEDAWFLIQQKFKKSKSTVEFVNRIVSAEKIIILYEYIIKT